MTHSHAKGRRSLGSKVRMETDGQMDKCDYIISRAMQSVTGAFRLGKEEDADAISCYPFCLYCSIAIVQS